jgi:hypothetical protein
MIYLKIAAVLVVYLAAVALLIKLHIKWSRERGVSPFFGHGGNADDQTVRHSPAPGTPSRRRHPVELNQQQREIVRAAAQSGYTASATTHRTRGHRAA